MLARSAEGIYWMARYTERAGFMCRLLQLQTEALVDRPIREIHFGWRRLYTAINRRPLGGMEGLDPTDDYNLVDAYFLTDELTFVRTNDISLLTCYESGRENARQVRNCISDEMWTALNTEYLKIQDVQLSDIWLSSPSSFYEETAAGIDRFTGVASATMYRDEGWHFFRIGQFVERVQFTCALLLAQTRLEEDSRELADADWRSLLRVFHAHEAYDRMYSIETQPQFILNVLVSDPQLPESLRRSLERAGQELDSLGDGPNPATSQAARRLAGRLSALIRFDWADRSDKEEFLTQVFTYSRQLHELVNEAFFNYPIIGIPRADVR